MYCISEKDNDRKEDEEKEEESSKEKVPKDKVEDDSEKQEQSPRLQKSPPAKNPKTPASTYEEKQRQLLLADCQRLKKSMTKVRNGIQRPPL